VHLQVKVPWREREGGREGETAEIGEAGLSPNHGWWVRGKEPKGTKISPWVTCRVL
jgi:hypothetical protein